MNGLEKLVACEGRWRGTNRLHDPNTNRPEDSPSTLVVTPILRGWFVRLDYSWAYQGAPQEGSLLVGYHAKAEKADAASAYWIDTWHNGHLGMTCRGTLGENGAVSVRGSYSAPPGPDWGWRTEIIPEGNTLHIVMFNVTPEGQEAVAVEASYTRA
jgi:hypothetical protein